MPLSDTERRILINQYRILSLLEPMPASGMAEDAELVCAVMHLHEQLLAWVEANDAPKSVTSHPRFTFTGFSPDAEPHHWHLQAFLSKDARRFPALGRVMHDQATLDPAPVHATVPAYRRMLERCAALDLGRGADLSLEGVSETDVLGILDAAGD